MRALVVGAGPVGAAFALLAARQGVVCTLIEAREGPSRETRSLALSHGSREILEAARVWEGLAATAITHIHTSQQGGFGRVRLSHRDAGVPALGYVVGYAGLQQALDDGLDAAGIPVLRGARVQRIDGATVACGHAGAGRMLEGDVVVMADGGANLDKLPGVAIEEKDYGQRAVLSHVRADRPHGGVAYERFTPEGPAALLPFGGPDEYSLVWVATPERAAELESMDAGAFLAAFQAHFGQRAGQFISLGARRSFPLKLRTVSTRVAGRVAIIGNAAQALHPVAGQGFNLGLRDAAGLARRLSAGDAEAALSDYAAARDRDVGRSVAFTDFLVGAFGNDHAAMRGPRGLALAALDLLPGARRALARRMLFGTAE